MSRAAAACTTQAKSNLHFVTLPDGQVVISSQPLLHNENGDAVNTLTTKRVKEIDGSVALFLAYLELMNVMPDRCVSKTKLPVFPIWNNICAFLTGKAFYLYLEDEFPGRKLARFSIAAACPYLLFAADQVVHAALCGDEALAKRMIEASPRYLLSRENATDFSGRTYTDITPFQAALITGDDKMAEMMKPFFDCLPNGEAEMQRQFAEIFPNGIEANEAAQKRKSDTKFVPMLDELIKAINKESTNDLQAALKYPGKNTAHIDNAFNTFRAEFTKLSQETIFNPHYLLAAFEAYVNEFNWSNPDWNKLNLFWRQVIGFVQRFLPATYAQAFAYSLYDIVENKHSCPRSFNFRYGTAFSFYPLTDSFAGLGFNFSAVDVARWRGWEGSERHGCRASIFSKLMSNKNNKLAELITRRMQQSHCVIA